MRRDAVNTASVSKILALQVVSASGVRLYISLGYNQNEVKTLHVAHIRLPPGLAPNAEPWKKPNDVNMIASNQDMTLTIAVAKDKTNSILTSNNLNLNMDGAGGILSGHGSYLNASSLSTTAGPTSGSTQKSGDILWLFNRPSSSNLSTIISSKEQSKTSIKDFNIMVNLGRKESHSSTILNSTCWATDELSDGSLVLITPEQIFLLNSFKPADELRLILLETRNWESPKVESFFTKYHGTGIASSACLELICEASEHREER